MPNLTAQLTYYAIIIVASAAWSRRARRPVGVGRLAGVGAVQLLGMVMVVAIATVVG
jgi:hypothetical protein